MYKMSKYKASSALSPSRDRSRCSSVVLLRTLAANKVPPSLSWASLSTFPQAMSFSSSCTPPIWVPGVPWPSSLSFTLSGYQVSARLVMLWDGFRSIWMADPSPSSLEDLLLYWCLPCPLPQLRWSFLGRIIWLKNSAAFIRNFAELVFKP
jgi:hypothetical protein